MRVILTFVLLSVTWPSKPVVIFLRDMFGPLPFPSPWTGLLLGIALLVGVAITLTRPVNRPLRATDQRLRELAVHLRNWKNLGRQGLPEHGRVLVAPNGKRVTLHVAWGMEAKTENGISATWLLPTEKQLQFLPHDGPRVLWIALPESSQGQYHPTDWAVGDGHSLIGRAEVIAEHLHRLTGTLPKRRVAETPVSKAPSAAPPRPTPQATLPAVPPISALLPVVPLKTLLSKISTIQPVPEVQSELQPTRSVSTSTAEAYALPQEVVRPVKDMHVLASPSEQMIRRLMQDALRQFQQELPWEIEVTDKYNVHVHHPDGKVHVCIWPHPDPAIPEHHDHALWLHFVALLAQEPCTAWVWSPLLRPGTSGGSLPQHVREIQGHARVLKEALEEGDPYRLLGVTPKSTADEVRAAYRQHIKAAHPDRQDGVDAQARSARLNAAYHQLTGNSA